MPDTYTIQHSLAHKETWINLHGFVDMRWPFARGAWQMLKSQNHGILRYRLLKNGEKIDETDVTHIQLN